MIEINFIDGQHYDSSYEVVRFIALVDGNKTRCAISSEALCDNFDGIHNDVLPSFILNRSKIEQIAARLIRQGAFQPDGSILIYSQNC